MPTTDWSSLSADLVSCIGDVLLDAGDIDYYVNLRAVCRGWRAATDKPRGLSRRFRPHRWVMLHDNLSRRVDSRLFLNLDTGRFLRKDLPLNSGYKYIGAADGLLVLEKDHGLAYNICVLNPFTGSMVRFPSTVASHRIGAQVAVGAGVAAPLLFLFPSGTGRWCESCDPSHPYPSWFRIKHISNTLISTVVSIQGRVYITDWGGSVLAVDCLQEGDKKPEITTIINRSMALGQNFLVDNAGELFLVCVPWHPMLYSKGTRVFKVDFEGKGLEPVRSIGSRAIFLGRRCCLSVNVDHLPAIQGNCVYYSHDATSRIQMYQYHLEDHSRKVLKLCTLDSPLSLAQVILYYCRGD